MKFSFSNRRVWIGLLLGLLIVNVMVYWPKAGEAIEPGRPPMPPGGSLPGAPGEIGFESALANLPETQRKEIQERLAADRAFFDSVKDLPETVRREKMKEHFAQNPPPQIPGVENLRPPPVRNGNTVGEQRGGVGGPPGFSGGGPGRNRLPAPEERRKIDKQIADSQKNRRVSP